MNIFFRLCETGHHDCGYPPLRRRERHTTMLRMTRFAPALALLALLSPACAADGRMGSQSERALEAVSEADGGVGGRPTFGPPAPSSFDHGDGDGDGGGHAGEPGPTLHDRYFGDSGWDCCTLPLCVGMCDEGETPTIDPTGGTVCCAPDVGQCDGELDAGV